MAVISSLSSWGNISVSVLEGVVGISQYLLQSILCTTKIYLLHINLGISFLRIMVASFPEEMYERTYSAPTTEASPETIINATYHFFFQLSILDFLPRSMTPLLVI